LSKLISNIYLDLPTLTWVGAAHPKYV
jgi:hypothetical protein